MIDETDSQLQKLHNFKERHVKTCTITEKQIDVLVRWTSDGKIRYRITCKECGAFAWY